MRSRRLLTFDVHETLWSFYPSPWAIYQQAATAHGLSVSLQVLQSSFITSYKRASFQFPNFGAQNSILARDWWMEVVKTTFLRSGIPFDRLDLVLEPLFKDIYRRFTLPESFRVFDDVFSTLQTLKTHRTDLSLGIISNSDARTRQVLESLDLARFFDFVLYVCIFTHVFCRTSHEEKVAKPDSKIFKKALDLSGVSAFEAMHVGEHLTNDYYGAREAGWTPFLLQRDSKAAGSLEIPKSSILTDLSQLLDRIPP